MTMTMKSENITRKLDSLGRVTLPKSLRARLNIADGAELEVFTCDYEGKTYAYFQPAEEVDGVAPEQVIVFEVDESGEDLIEIEDKELENKLLEEFSNDYLGEYVNEEEYYS